MLRRFSFFDPPVHRLPPELLSYIFELSSLDYSPLDNKRSDHHLRPFGTETITPPLVFSGVCRRWRHVAHATGSIWSRICITAELLDPRVPISQAPLQADYIVSFLRHSHNRPLDIVIDARDPYWDFSEPGIPSDGGLNSYSPPFSAAHMATTLTLLLPHLDRWRSLDVMTDTWVPMHTALTALNEHMNFTGASFPHLESLTLMRCNDYSSYAPVFEPTHLKTPTFLDISRALYSTAAKMPSLRSLVLRGVHVDWTALPALLPKDPSRMQYLELGSHARDVRPTEDEFRGILLVCPALEKLSIDGSGPFETGDAINFPMTTTHPPTTVEDENLPVQLPRLKKLCLGYRSVTAGRKLLELVDAPALEVLSLSDTTNPIEPLDIDASGLLRYLGTGAGRLIPLSAACDTTGHGPFPHLRELAFCGTKAALPAIQDVYRNMNKLQRLELHSVSMDFVKALEPAAIVVACPCPALRSLTLRELDFFGHTQMEEVVEVEQKRLGGGGDVRQWEEIHVRMRRGLESLRDGVQKVVDENSWTQRCQVTVPEPIVFSDDESDELEDFETDDSDDDEEVDIEIAGAGGGETSQLWDEHFLLLEGPAEASGKPPARAPFAIPLFEEQSYYATGAQMVFDVVYFATHGPHNEPIGDVSSFQANSS